MLVTSFSFLQTQQTTQHKKRLLSYNTLTEIPTSGRNDENTIIVKDLHSKALEYCKEKKFSEAIQAYNKIIGLSPPSFDFEFERAACLNTMGYVDESINGFLSAMDLIVNQTSESFSSDIVATRERAIRRVNVKLSSLYLDGKGEKDAYDDIDYDNPLIAVKGICLDSVGQSKEARACYERSLKLMNCDADFQTMMFLCINLYRSKEGRVCGADDFEEQQYSALLAKIESSPCSYLASSWAYILNPISSDKGNEKIWALPSIHYFTYDMVKLAVSQTTSSSPGLVLEFGVCFGKTIRMMADLFPEDQPIYGFDTFEGLPSDWHHTKKGSYSTSGELPRVSENVKFYKGLFSDTLPIFLNDIFDSTVDEDNDHNGMIKLMNIDCDMYESTKDVFDNVHHLVKAGTIILFDEYIGNPNWEKDEFKAFQEAVEEYGWTYEYIGISMISQQAVVRITEVL